MKETANAETDLWDTAERAVKTRAIAEKRNENGDGTEEEREEEGSRKKKKKKEGTKGVSRTLS